MEISPRQQLEQKLNAIEAQLAISPKVIDLQFERASVLITLGQIEQGKQAYIEILLQDPTHFATLNNLAILLEETNYRSAARALYNQAVTHHPNNPLGHVNFGNLLLYAGDYTEAREQYETAVTLDPDNMHAHRGLSLLFQEIGEEDKMQYHRIKGYRHQPVTAFPYVGKAEAIPLLLLTSTMGGGDLPWRRLIDNNVFQVTAITAEFYNPSEPLPPHKLVFNAIGDADTCQSDLKAAEALIQHTTAPVINSPLAVLTTGRTDNADRLGTLPGVVTPRHAILTPEMLENKEAIETLLTQNGLNYPLLLRSPGFHTGKHFVRVDHLDGLISAALTLPRKWLMVLEYLDSRGVDGFARKYRVMTIDGKLYPLHLAVSADWKVHYFTSEMTNNAVHQAEEAEFLNDMQKVLGEKVMTALYAIQDALGLDYGGVDFGIKDTGDLLLFEANATMNIIPPDADPQWNYRRPAIFNALSATHNLLLSRAGQ